MPIKDAIASFILFKQNKEEPFAMLLLILFKASLAADSFLLHP